MELNHEKLSESYESLKKSMEEYQKALPIDCQNCFIERFECSYCSNFNERKEAMLKHCHAMDLKMFLNTKYAGMEFTNEPEWDAFTISEDSEYVSPVYIFENGTKIAFNRYGEICEL